MSSLVCAGRPSAAGKITRSALETRSSRPPASTKTSSERAMRPRMPCGDAYGPSGLTRSRGLAVRRPTRCSVRSALPRRWAAVTRARANAVSEPPRATIRRPSRVSRTVTRRRRCARTVTVRLPTVVRTPCARRATSRSVTWQAVAAWQLKVTRTAPRRTRRRRLGIVRGPPRGPRAGATTRPGAGGAAGGAARLRDVEPPVEERDVHLALRRDGQRRLELVGVGRVGVDLDRRAERVAPVGRPDEHDVGLRAVLVAGQRRRAVVGVGQVQLAIGPHAARGQRQVAERLAREDARDLVELRGDAGR